MSVPDYQSLMLPALKALSSGGATSIADVRKKVAYTQGLTVEDRQELLPSGGQTVFANRIAWALTYMTHAGLVERVRRGVYQLGAQGEQLLEQPPSRIDLRLLQEYPEFAE